MEFVDYVDRQRAALMRFATVLTGQVWLADDVVSNVLGRAFERWNQIGSMSDPHAYVRRMVVNEYLSWRRLARAVPRAELDSLVAQVPDGSAGHAERDEMISRLSRLPRKQRAAIVLRYYLGLSNADIASYLDCRESTVRSQLTRALASLRLELSSADATRATDLTKPRRA